jgi:hypothetical protein
MSGRAKNILLKVSIGCWLLVTLAALAGMYQLWQQRERMLYLGKSPAEQRRIVFERAGLPPVLADKTAKLAAQWPADLRYKARGDANALSYIQYLLIPRIPAGKAEHVLQVKGSVLTVSGPPAGQPDKNSLPRERSSPQGLILSFAVLLGWAALLRKMWRGQATWPECLALACLFFTLLTLPVRFFFLSAAPAFGGAVILALVGWAMLLGNALVSRLSGPAPAPAVMPRHEQLIAGLLGLIIALAVLWSFLMAVVVVPDDWDAWTMWGSKAKVLALGSGPLKDVTRFGHPDYPLLWPTIWALSGWLAGGWEECWSKGWGAVFLLLCLWEMMAAVRRESGSLLAGFFAAALFASVPNVPLIASWGYAEAPLWLMMTCGLSAFLRWQSDSRRADAILAALFAAGAALTKNEGLLFALLLGLMLLGSGRGRLKAALLYLLTFAGCTAFWFWWSRLHLDLSSQAASGLHWNAASLRHAAGRLLPAGKAIWAMWKDVRQWNLVGFGILFALPALLLRRGHDLPPLFLPIALLTGYLAIILFSSNEIYWQIGTAWNRLTVQTLPLLLILLVPPGWERMSNARGDSGACSQKDANRPGLG